MSFRLKLRHAEACLERLEHATERWAETHPPTFPVETKLHPGQDKPEKIVSIEIAPLPKEWSLDVGDILSNLRASLDHLAFELAVKGKGADLTGKEAGGSAFPVYGRSRPSASELRRQIGCIDPRAQTIIKRLQPCTVANYGDHELWILHTLNNIDKHRTIHVVTAAVSAFDIRPGGPVEVLYELVVPRDGIDIVNGTVVSRFFPQEDMEVEADVTIAYRIREPELTLGALPIAEQLRNLLNFVKFVVVPSLEPFLV
jgi:hypothetical protein